MNPTPVKMTRAEYQTKYGVAPAISAVPKPVASTSNISKNPTVPVKMTRAEYQTKYGVAPTSNVQTPIKTPESNPVRGGFVGDMLTGSTQKFGKTIGDSLASGGNADLYSESLESHDKVKNDLSTRIAEKRKLGQDTSRLEVALATHIQSTPQLKEFTGDVIDKTAGQVVGEGLGTGLEALSGGLFSSGKNVIASKTLSTAQKIGQGAGIGALYGGLGGTSSSMQEGDGFSDTIKGAGQGAVIGGAIGAVAPVVAAGVKKTGIFANAAEKETAKFNKNLKKAEESIFPKLSGKEKAAFPKKEAGLFGTKSVPDLQSNPKTKKVIESVANLPDDLKLKPVLDTPAQKESKITQGISRLHQSRDTLLSDEATKAQTKFVKKGMPVIDYDTGRETPVYEQFMKKKILEPVKKEFGEKSIEYKIAQKGLKTSMDAIEEETAYGVDKARQKFDTIFKSENKSAFADSKNIFDTNPAVKATVRTGQNIRNAMNEFSDSLLPPNHPAVSLRQEEHNLLRALDEMKKRSIGQLNKGIIRRGLDKNPTLKRTLNAVWQGTKIGTGAKMLGF